MAKDSFTIGSRFIGKIMIEKDGVETTLTFNQTMQLIFDSMANLEAENALLKKRLGETIGTINRNQAAMGR